MINYDLSKEYIQYNDDVLNHKIVTNKFIYQACERFQSWFYKEDRYLDYDDIDKKINFMQKIKHSKGKFAGKNFKLLPYQQWITANIIGWKWKETNTRVINTALLMLARKAGKTFFSACLMLAIILTDKELGAEGYMIANSAKQASIAFEHASNSCKSLDPNGKIFSRFRSDIRIPLLNSKIQILSSETNKLDGLSPSVFIVDEYGEAQTNENFNILRTGQGIRENALGIIISTASFRVGPDYPLYSAWENAKNVLDNVYEQDSLFAAIYQLDEGDDYKNKDVWVKSNPTLGDTVSYKYLEEQVKSAVNDPTSEVSIKTKNFNCWCQTSETWLSIDDINKVKQKINLEDFKDNEDIYGIGAIDLSEVDDLTVYTLLIVDESNDMLYYKCYPFIPLKALEKSTNKEMYQRWIDKGYLILIEEEVIDLDVIEAKIWELDGIIPTSSIAYDPWKCKQLALKFKKNGLPMMPCGQGLANFTEPTREFSRLVYQKRLVIDDNPVLLWNISNAKLKYDANGNFKPTKETSANKIDCVITMIQATKIWMEINGIVSLKDLDAVALD